jgi:hypothetical protein
VDPIAPPADGGEPTVRNDGQGERTRPDVLRIAKYVLEVGAYVAAIITVWAAIDALNVYKAANRVLIRTQLYDTEQLISEREMADPTMMQLLFYPTEPISPTVWIQQSLQLMMPEQDVTAIRSVADLEDAIFGLTASVSPQQQYLIRLRLQAETYLYHLHNVYDSSQEGMITPAEADTWLGLVTDLGAHPMFLNAIYSSYVEGYLSAKFARELQRRFVADDQIRAVVSVFYPDMLLEDWPDKLPSY